MIAKCCKCLAVAAASICLLFGRVDVAQGAATDPGQPKWSHTTTPAPGGKVNGSPAISADGQTIYITSEDGYVHTLVANSGQEVAGWPVDKGNIASSGSGEDELICSPVVASDGTVYVASTDGNLYNINTDGSLNWSLQVPNGISGVVGAVALSPDGTVYVTYDDDSKLRAIDPSRRKPKWEFNVSACAGGPSMIDSAPSVGPDGTIYFYAAGGGLMLGTRIL
jgi:outer membrane protein assembly factor BamB